MIELWGWKLPSQRRDTMYLLWKIHFLNLWPIIYLQLFDNSTYNELEELKNRTYHSWLAILEPKEPLSKFPSIDTEEPELLEDPE